MLFNWFTWINNTLETTLYLFHDREDPGLIIVVSVCSDTQVDLLWKRVGFICGSELEDAVIEESESGLKA
jgi:hypothetical protein